jgi:cellulose synthase/poly-beta-1,6-N-acetylglucosamine synthase-like glycosyltransferase
MRGMLFISGVFGLFSRDVFIAVGGYDTATDGDDIDFMLRVHERMRRARAAYRVEFVPDPCCWTTAPDTLAELGRQRRRWAQILSESLRLHWHMIGNPRYGFIGMVAMPHFLFFELGSAIVELTGLVVFPVGLVLGIVGLPLAMLYVFIAIGYATLLSLLALVVEEFSYSRYRTARDVAIAALAAFGENIGFRQMHAWWRLRGMITTLRGRKAQWETSNGSLGRFPRPPVGARPGRMPD